MSTNYKYKDGRVWVQQRKFEPFKLLLPYGLTGATDPVGNLNAIREPSPSVRGETEIVDMVRAEPALPQFAIETRLKRTKNFLLALQRRVVNFQAHMGNCDRPDNYYASSFVINWDRCHRADAQIDRLSLIEGDNQPTQISTSFMAEFGPVYIDLEAAFLSARTVGSALDATCVGFLPEEFLENCQNQEDAGENGYIGTKALVGSPVSTAKVLFTTNKGETWAATSTDPFSAAKEISDILVIGTKTNHRVIVSCGTTDPAAPAKIAYSDVTHMGTTSWVPVSISSVNGQYVTALYFLNWNNIYAATDDGHIYKSNDGGASWALSYDGLVTFNAIAGASDGTIWAVGASNTLVRSDDNGETWTVVDGPATINQDMTAVAVTADKTVFVGASDGKIYGSFNNGEEWTTLPLQGVTATAVTAIETYGDSVIWVSVTTAAGGRVLRSIDGGAGFRLWDLNLPANSGVNDLALINQNVIWAVGPAHTGVAFATHTNSRIIDLS